MQKLLLFYLQEHGVLSPKVQLRTDVALPRFDSEEDRKLLNKAVDFVTDNGPDVGKVLGTEILFLGMSCTLVHNPYFDYKHYLKKTLFSFKSKAFYRGAKF